MIRIIGTVLSNGSAVEASLRNAAVECVEQWLQLPGVGLDQWTGLLAQVFQAVTDDALVFFYQYSARLVFSTALTNLLSILASNDELVQLEQLVVDICRYIADVIAQKVIGQLQESPDDTEDVLALVSAMCTLAEKAMPTLIKQAKEEPENSLLL